MAEIDPLAVLSLLGGDSGAPEGDPAFLGLNAAIGGSEFLQGQPSQAGPLGQIAQALMPLIQAKAAEQQIRQKQEQEQLRKLFLLKQIEAIGKKDQPASQAELDAVAAQSKTLPPGTKTKIDRGGVSYEFGGTADEKLPTKSSLALRAAQGDAEAQKALKILGEQEANSPLSRVANALMAAGMSEADARAAEIRQKGGVVRDATSGAWIYAPSATEQAKAYNSVRAVEQQMPIIDSILTTIRKDPGAVGTSGEAKGLYQSTLASIADMAKKRPEVAQDPLVAQLREFETTIPAQAASSNAKLRAQPKEYAEGDPALLTGASTTSFNYKSFFNPNIPAYLYSINRLAFLAALSNNPDGRISDADVEASRRQITGQGSGFFSNLSPVSSDQVFAALTEHKRDLIRQREYNRKILTPGGFSLDDTATPPSASTFKSGRFTVKVK